jgi:hypothetical protein
VFFSIFPGASLHVGQLSEIWAFLVYGSYSFLKECHNTYEKANMKMCRNHYGSTYIVEGDIEMNKNEEI